MSGGERRVVCVCCGVEGPFAARDLIRACYLWHRLNGTLANFPVDKEKWRPMRRAQADRAREARDRLAAERAEEYAFLRSCGESAEQAAKQLGLRPSLAQRYERMAAQQSAMAS